MAALALAPAVLSTGLGAITGTLLEQFAASMAPVYFTVFVGVGFCFTDVLKLDFVPAISVIIQYVGLPTLLFLRIAETPTSHLNLKLLLADALSKLVPLVLLLIWWRFFSKLGKVKSIEWLVTFWMLATLPNTVFIGDQILTPLFNNPQVTTESWTTTIIFAQSLYWYNCVILLMEIREMFIEDEKKDLIGGPEIAPELSEELAEMEKQQKMYDLENMEKSRPSWDMGRPSSAWEANGLSAWEANRPSVADRSRPSWEIGRPSWSKAPYDSEMNDYSIGSMTPLAMTPRSVATPTRTMTPGMTPGMTPRMTPRSGFTPSRVALSHLDREQSIHSVTPSKFDPDQSMTSISLSKGFEAEFDPAKVQTAVDPAHRNPTSVLARTLLRVLQRVLQVPLLYGTVLGFVWAINEWKLPLFLKISLSYCSQVTIGLAMILLGQICVKNIYGARGWVPCGWKLLFAGFGLRFLFAPIVMYVCSIVVSIKGTLLPYAILQVIVPQGIMTFALAQIYSCKLSVITPAIYVQLIVFVPILFAYSAVLAKLG